MKKIVSMLLTIAVIASMLVVPAFAAETETAPAVRVNGDLVAFPDGQPYINSDNRTLIPVRFATEALGANVTWVPETSTAVMEKNGIKVEVTIGNADIKVTDATGTVKTVTMDTVAVLRYDRTYVPIRFVAENLGAWVSFSDYYNTVQISGCDKVSAQEIIALHQMTDKMYQHALANPRATANDWKPYADGTYGQENLNEWIFRNWPSKMVLTETLGTGKYYPGMSKTSDIAYLCIDETAKYLETYVKLIGGMTGATVTFKSDVSCVVRNPQFIWIEAPMLLVPGYMTITVPADATAANIKFLTDEFSYPATTPDSISFAPGQTYTLKVAVSADAMTINSTTYGLEMHICRNATLYA